MNLQELVDRAEGWGEPSKLRRLRAAVLGLMFLSFSTCLAAGANGPQNPSLAEAATIAPFGEIGFKIIPYARKSGMPPTEAGLLCALLADTELTRDRNLTGRGDLAGYSGMVLDFGQSTSQPFQPTSINLALTVAFYRADGAILGVADTEICAGQTLCPPVAAPAPYRYLLLMAKGALASVGGPEAKLELGGDCSPGPV